MEKPKGKQKQQKKRKEEFKEESKKRNSKGPQIRGPFTSSIFSILTLKLSPSRNK